MTIYLFIYLFIERKSLGKSFQFIPVKATEKVYLFVFIMVYVYINITGVISLYLTYFTANDLF